MSCCFILCFCVFFSFFFFFQVEKTTSVTSGQEAEIKLNSYHRSFNYFLIVSFYLRRLTECKKMNTQCSAVRVCARSFLVVSPSFYTLIKNYRVKKRPETRNLETFTVMICLFNHSNSFSAFFLRVGRGFYTVCLLFVCCFFLFI